MKSSVYEIYQQQEVITLVLTLDSATIFRNEELLRPFSQLLEEGKKNIVLDLSNTSYISSVLISEMVSMLKKAKTMGGDLVLCNLQDSVKDVLKTTTLDRVFHVFETGQDAVNSFSKKL